MNERIAQIARDTRELGICPGDTVLVHSSLKSLGKGVTPEDVIRGLGMAVGESGTLMFPALSYFSCNREHPHFDYHRSPSNVGAIPEYFRTEVDGVVRSMNPTHSCCALGRYAEELTKDHWQDHTPCGANSPYRRLYELSGKILFIGCGTRCNTSMHAVEELVRPPYLFSDMVHYTTEDRYGNEGTAACLAHDFHGVEQRYDRLLPLLPAGAAAQGKIGPADAVWMDARAVWDTAVQWYRADPWYFVDRLEPKE